MYMKTRKTRGPWTLAFCLTAAVGMTLANHVLQTCIKNSQLRTKSIEIWVKSLTQYFTMHLSILDHIRHFNFDLPRSLKVKCDGGFGLPIYDFLSVFNSDI